MRSSGFDNIIHHDPEDPRFKRRMKIVFVCVISGFTILFLRLWQIQILEGSKFKEQAKINSLRMIDIDAPRGRILDRFGRPIVENRPTFDVSIVLEDVRDEVLLIQKLADILDIDTQTLTARIRDAEKKGIKKFKPLTILRDISREQLARLKENSYDIPGVHVNWKPTRNYLFNEMAAHLIGHIGEADEKDLKFLRSYKGEVYSLGEYVGKSGIERSMEMVLKGQKGKRVIEVDASGREIKLLGEKEPLPGADLELTIDLDLQIEARDILKDKAGIIIAINPQNGEILAYQSSPSYNPNFFSGISPAEEWKAIAQDESSPLEDRGIRGLYPPGSTFKVVLAAAALEEGIPPSTSWTCTGVLNFGKRPYRCWKKEGHGKMDLYNAILNSCDVYFYQLGLRLGVDTISRYAKKLGFMQTTGFNLKEEKIGVVPDAKWKQELMNEPWFPGETLSFSIGQSYLLSTPLQLLQVYQAIANYGVVWTPIVLKRILSPEGEPLKQNQPSVLRKVEFKKSTFDFLKNALRGVVMEKGGTGRAAMLKDHEVAGKTGTSQVATTMSAKHEELPHKLRDHALFVGYSTPEAPSILVVAVIEHGGSGGKAAAPVVGRLIKKYWELKQERELRSIKFTGRIDEKKHETQTTAISQ